VRGPASFLSDRAPRARRIFDPSFTTKGERGTGLGLAQVMAAVEQHHGRLEVDTAPDQRTTFRVLFPAARLAESGASAAAAEPTPATSRGLCILAVDDEERLARLVVRMLGSEGHQVTTASSGEQALELMGRESFELVITDLGLGVGMNGWEVADTVRERYPGVRVILASGWGADITAEDAAAHSVVAVVAKPYSARDLRQLVASIASTGVSA
jgi:CheY-like chemotaxis protein